MKGNKTNMKFIRTDNTETAYKLRYEGYTEIAQLNENTYCFLNDGKKLTFNAEENGVIYTNILHF